MSTATNENKLRHHAEQQFAEELEELKKSDARQRPANWELSPWAVAPTCSAANWTTALRCPAK